MNRREFLKYSFQAGALTLLAAPLQLAEAAEDMRWHERMQPMMGTFVSVAMLSSNREEALSTLGRCLEVMRSAAFELSQWEELSFVSALNRERARPRQSVPGVVERLHQTAALIESSAGGRFRLQANSLTDLWRRARVSESLPDRIQIAEAVQNVRESGVVITRDTVSCPGQSGIDSGGIGKGLVADIGAEYLRSQSVARGRVACSGDIRFVGSHPWSVEVEDPRSDTPLRKVTLAPNAAIATSGDYRSCWFVNGKRYHHLIDPRTGLPGEVNQQATVIAPTGVLADALASAMFFMEPAEGEKFVRKYSGVGALLVDAGHRVREVR